MAEIKVFEVNPFQENSIVIADSSKTCAIIDPGFSNAGEQELLKAYIAGKDLTPVLLLNTHCHIDHVLGNRFIADEYKLELQIHESDLPLLKAAEQFAHLYNLNYDPSPLPRHFFKENDVIEFGNSRLEVLHIPGHAPGHVVFVNHEDRTVIGGDVLFRGSIGRTDLPGGNHDLLLNSIKTKLFTLPDDYVVYPGHGPETTIGFEKTNNPFF